MKRSIGIVAALTLALVVFAGVRSWPRDELAGISALQPVQAVGDPAEAPIFLNLYFKQSRPEVEAHLDARLLRNSNWTKTVVNKNEVDYFRSGQPQVVLVRVIGPGGSNWPKGARSSIEINQTTLATRYWEEVWRKAKAAASTR